MSIPSALKLGRAGPTQIGANFIITLIGGIEPDFEVDFTATPISGSVPLIVEFTDTTIGTPTGWEWDFGDGTSKLYGVQNPRHVYAAPGSYTVSLIATDGEHTDTETKIDYITVSSYTLDFTAAPRSGTEPLTVQFTEGVIGVSPDYLWNFGNGQTSTDRSPSPVTYRRGTYSPRLTIRKRLP